MILICRITAWCSPPLIVWQCLLFPLNYSVFPHHVFRGPIVWRWGPDSGDRGEADWRALSRPLSLTVLTVTPDLISRVSIRSGAGRQVKTWTPRPVWGRSSASSNWIKHYIKLDNHLLECIKCHGDTLAVSASQAREHPSFNLYITGALVLNRINSSH